MHKFNFRHPLPKEVIATTLNAGDFFFGVRSGNLYLVIDNYDSDVTAFNLNHSVLSVFHDGAVYPVKVEAKLQPNLTGVSRIDNFVIPLTESRKPEIGEFFIYGNVIYLKIAENKLFDIRSHKVIVSCTDLSKASILSAEFTYEVARA